MMNFTTNTLAGGLKELGSQIFLSTLSKIHGTKDLILTETILVQLDSICGMQKLRQNAVDKVFKLQVNINSETPNRVFVLRPVIEDIEVVAQQINTFTNHKNNSAELSVHFWIVFIPSMPYFCELALEEEGIYENVTVLECPLYFFPLEYDVYSLEDQRIFKTLYLNRDFTPVNEIVASIDLIQRICGVIPIIHGSGRYSKIVADKVIRVSVSSSNLSDKRMKIFCPSTPEGDSDSTKPLFTHLYLFDRDCDYASILLSSLNYEGILDESFSITCNKFEFKDRKDSEENPTLVTHSLSTENDPIFRDIRDNHFSTVFSHLKVKNREMKEKYDRSRDMNLSNLKNFVANELKNLQLELKCLALHIGACEEIMRERRKYNFGDQLKSEHDIIDGEGIRDCLSYVNKLIVHQMDPFIPLRLLALLSLTQGGLPPRDYTHYRSSYCENFGLFNNKTFDNLCKLGLITEMELTLGGLIGKHNISQPNQKPSGLSLTSLSGAMSSFTEAAGGKFAAVVSSSVLPRKGNLSYIIKKLQLAPPLDPSGYNIREPKDPAFVFGGAYIPLVCQLIDWTLLKSKAPQNCNKLLADANKWLPGQNFEIKHPLVDHEKHKDNDKSILVYFVGGATFAEITALRFLAKVSGCQIVIATTSIINGNRLIKNLMPPIPATTTARC